MAALLVNISLESTDVIKNNNWRWQNGILEDEKTFDNKDEKYVLIYV